MKRSEINALMAEAEAFFAQHHFALPPWAAWSPEQWQSAGTAASEVARHSLGWDITDFGSGDFAACGLLLFTIRNGCLGEPVTPKPYAEKIMITRPGQVVPAHFHWHKTEDIIVRGGGRLVLRLWNATADDELDSGDVTVSVDGIRRSVPSGGTLRLNVGESITLTPRLYHAFWGQEGDEPVLVGEVSAVNDDACDNRFLEPVGRFPQVEEDVAPRHLLCTEYPAALTA